MKSSPFNARAALGVDPSLVGRFIERIATDLDREPLTISVRDHRTKAAELLACFGDLNFYDLLGIGRVFTDAEVYEAYLKMGRLVHPRHASALGLEGREGVLGVLFEKVTEAYLVLSDPIRRRVYEAEAKPTGQGFGENRKREKLEVGREFYLQAREFVGRGEFHLALEILEQAVRLDPRAEGYAMMAEVQAKNPRWVEKAAGSLMKAIELAPGEIEYRLALARIWELLKRFHDAHHEYTKILELRPESSSAQLGKERIEGQVPELATTTKKKRRWFFR